MTNDFQSITNTLRLLVDNVQKPYWGKAEFWAAALIGILGVIVSAIGLYYSVKAFKEAREAKHAATEAGKTVKIQTITIELTEILQKLDKLQPQIQFSDARDLLTEISRRLRRLTSPFQKDPELLDTINALRAALTSASNSLNSVQPSDPNDAAEAPLAVYNATQGAFASISNTTADLLGLCEKK